MMIVKPLVWVETSVGEVEDEISIVYGTYIPAVAHRPTLVLCRGLIIQME